MFNKQQSEIQKIIFVYDEHNSQLEKIWNIILISYVFTKQFSVSSLVKLCSEFDPMCFLAFLLAAAAVKARFTIIPSILQPWGKLVANVRRSGHFQLRTLVG